jgi:hypothetical protein
VKTERVGRHDVCSSSCSGKGIFTAEYSRERGPARGPVAAAARMIRDRQVERALTPLDAVFGVRYSSRNGQTNAEKSRWVII